MNYLNTKKQTILFEEIVKNPFYVDKSLLIDEISKRICTNNKYICITRPRCFGKTVNANMLGAYYTKGYKNRYLFQGLNIECTDNYEKHLNKHNVITIDFSQIPDFCESYREYMKSIIKKLRSDLEKKYKNIKEEDYDSISDMFHHTGERFIFILDEWDAIFYRSFMKREDKSEYLLFLRSLLKDQPYVELAYMTGVLPIAKYSSGSELNMFAEYNFINDNIFDKYFGFCEKEVQRLCQMSSTISYQEMKSWYDGYYTSNGQHLFNPRSINMALLNGVCRNYWTETGPMNEIAVCIEHNIDEVRDDIVKMVSNIPIEIELEVYSAIEQQLNTRDEILSAMVVYGFLSYYKDSLCIPNHELMEKFQKVLQEKVSGK